MYGRGCGGAAAAPAHAPAAAQALVELSRLAVAKELTLIVAWNSSEAGRYLETFKAYENKPPDMLKGVKAADHLGQLREVLSTAKRVNKSDTVTLVSTFGSLHDIIEAGADELQYCPGFGEQKVGTLAPRPRRAAAPPSFLPQAQRLHDIFRTPFVTRAGMGTGTGRKFASRIPSSVPVSAAADDADEG